MGLSLTGLSVYLLFFLKKKNSGKLNICSPFGYENSFLCERWAKIRGSKEQESL